MSSIFTKILLWFGISVLLCLTGFTITSRLEPNLWRTMQLYLWTSAATVALGYILAVQLASPLHKLEQTVERFGRGDLTVRADASRKDEFGNLARAFNVMADRIQTLLSAERRLLQDVSHELRSPLARLEFAVALARSQPDRETSIDRIRREIERLSTLVAQLVEVARPDSDEPSHAFALVNLTALLESVLNDNALEAEAHNCGLHLSTSAPVAILGNQELLRRAIENVLRNAIRYAPPHTAIAVELNTSLNTAAITIRDWGPGVAPENLPHIFRPFFRVEPDRSRAGGAGVGLGLSIAQRAVSVHQGSIEARNANPGLLVEMKLPLTAANPGTSAHPNTQSGAQSSDEPGTSSAGAS